MARPSAECPTTIPTQGTTGERGTRVGRGLTAGLFALLFDAGEVTEYIGLTAQKEPQ